MQVDLNVLGDLIADLIADAVEPLEKSNAELRHKLDALELREPQRGEPGKDGRDGADGKSVAVEDVAEFIAEHVKTAVDAIPRPSDGRDGEDAEPVLVADVVSELISTKALDAVLDLMAADAVAKHFEANPVRDGKDGASGKDGEQGPQGEAGKSVTLDDVSIFLDAAIAKHVLELERRATDSIQRAIDKIPTPKDGKDGVDLTDCTISYDGERTFTIKAHGAEIVKRLPIPLYKGYWRDGMACEHGDVVTHDGSSWSAMRDTKAKPTFENKEDWNLFSRKGRDGKDGRNGIDKTAPVNLRDDDA